MSNLDGANMWEVVHSLNSNRDANSPNEAMLQNVRTITNI